MNSRPLLAVLTLILSSVLTAAASAVPSTAAGEYAKHFAALSGLSVAVAQAMPADQYSFRPHPESMDFGQLMSHIATTNYQFCPGLKDTQPPALPSPTEKDAVVKFLSDSFAPRRSKRRPRSSLEKTLIFTRIGFCIFSARG